MMDLDFACRVVRMRGLFGERIQGFLYGTDHVIRDVWAPWGEQEIYRCPAAEVSDKDFSEMCETYRMAYALRELERR